MKQQQFETLLSWLMLNTFFCAGIYEQNQLGRALTDDEHNYCLQRVNTAARTMDGFLGANRRGS